MVNGNTTSESRTTQRERMLSTVGGVLGVLMFVLGFLRWLSIGEGDAQSTGFAVGMPTTAVIGLSLAAGLIALFGATEGCAGRGVPSAVPTGLAATSFLLAVGIYLGKGAISPDLGNEVGVEVGLVLGLLTAAVHRSSGSGSGEPPRRSGARRRIPLLAATARRS